jgi:hypothetical protein
VDLSITVSFVVFCEGSSRAGVNVAFISAWGGSRHQLALLPAFIH